MVIFDKRDDAEKQLYEDWEKVDLDDFNFELAYTKKGNKLPLSNFDVTVGTPCMDSSYQISSDFS